MALFIIYAGLPDFLPIGLIISFAAPTLIVGGLSYRSRAAGLPLLKKQVSD